MRQDLWEDAPGPRRVLRQEEGCQRFVQPLKMFYKIDPFPATQEFSLRYPTTHLVTWTPKFEFAGSNRFNWMQAS